MRRVYFIRRADNTGPIKIGCSSCPSARAKQLGFDMRTSFKVLAEVPAGLEVERELHDRFAQDRVKMDCDWDRPYPLPGKTEWFEESEALLSVIADVKCGRLKVNPACFRDQKIAMAYLSGLTLQQVGDQFGMTRERVRQILNEHGYPSNPKGRREYLASRSIAA